MCILINIMRTMRHFNQRYLNNLDIFFQSIKHLAIEPPSYNIILLNVEVTELMELKSRQNVPLFHFTAVIVSSHFIF